MKKSDRGHGVFVITNDAIENEIVAYPRTDCWDVLIPDGRLVYAAN
jgi:hypothetical protein